MTCRASLVVSPVHVGHDAGLLPETGSLGYLVCTSSPENPRTGHWLYE